MLGNVSEREEGSHEQYFGEEGDAGDVGEYFGDDGDIWTGAIKDCQPVGMGLAVNSQAKRRRGNEQGMMSQ